MTLRLGTGWQTVMADLALILFLVTAQAVREQPAEPRNTTAARPSEGGLAVYRPNSGLPLAPWLASTITDDRQLATVLVRHRAENRSAAMEEGAHLLREIESVGFAGRLLIESSSRPETVIMVDFAGQRTDGMVLAQTE